MFLFYSHLRLLLTRQPPQFSCLNFLEGLEGFSVAPFTRVLGWSREEVEVLLARTRAETVKRSIHGWQKGYVHSPFEDSHHLKFAVSRITT